jgi:hypothetical protein
MEPVTRSPQYCAVRAIYCQVLYHLHVCFIVYVASSLAVQLVERARNGRSGEGPGGAELKLWAADSISDLQISRSKLNIRHRAHPLLPTYTTCSHLIKSQARLSWPEIKTTVPEHHRIRSRTTPSSVNGHNGRRNLTIGRQLGLDIDRATADALAQPPSPFRITRSAGTRDLLREGTRLLRAGDKR